MGLIPSEISDQPSGRHSRQHDDELNMHFPRGYIASLAGESPRTNEEENLEWAHLKILETVQDIVDSSIAPPTELDGDTFIIDATSGVIAVDTILFQSGNTVRYNLAGATSVAVGDFAIFSSSTNSINDGTFQITGIDGSFGLFVEITNAGRANADDDETPSSPATMNTTHDDWDGADHNNWVRYNGALDQWFNIIQEDGDFVFNNTPSAVFTFTGGSWSQQVAPAAVFGSDYNAQRDSSDTVTSSTSLVTHATLNISVAAGTYLLKWHYIWNYDNTNRNFTGEIQVDAANVHTEQHVQEPSDGAAGQRFHASGEAEIVLGAGAHAITVHVAAGNVADVATIFESNLSIFRVV